MLITTTIDWRIFFLRFMDVILVVTGASLARCCLILGDQLSIDLPSLQLLEPEDVVVIAEVWSEASYVKHHKQKIALIFSAMRRFAADLRDTLVVKVIYIELTDSENSQSLVGEVERLQIAHQFDAWYVTEPGEWRLKNEFEALTSRIPVPFEICPDKRFICSHEEFNEFLKVETTSDGALLSEDQAIDRSTDGRQGPVGGEWNFDHDNRKALDRRETPSRPTWPVDAITEEVFELVNTHFADIW